MQVGLEVVESTQTGRRVLAFMQQLSHAYRSHVRMHLLLDWAIAYEFFQLASCSVVLTSNIPLLLADGTCCSGEGLCAGLALSLA